MLEFMKEGGLPMWLLLLLALPAVGFAITHGFVARRWSLAATLTPLALAMLVGALATVRARTQVAKAVVGVDPSMREEMERVGDLQAGRPLELALLIGALSIVPLGIGEARLLKARRDPPPA